jgi:hypothetical protein
MVGAMTTLDVPVALAPSRPTARVGRTLPAYLLVPRPKDLVKALVAPLAFAVGAVAAGGVEAAQLGRALLVWAALELLVYQARYQWNDVRGFAADQAHPDAASRGRLPGPVGRARPHIAASLAVMGVRLLLAGLLALALPEAAGVLLAMTVGVFGVAVVYERLRSAATGRTAQVPVPLRPALVALWIAVGAGYAVRGLTGLALAVDLRGRPGLLAASVVTMWALGIVFVTCRWALEAMSFGSFEGGRVRWRARSDQAREHTLGLVRWLPSHPPGDGASGPSGWRALRGRTSVRAPWNLALTVATAAAALAGHLLAGGSSVRATLLVALVGALTALALSQLPRWRAWSGAGAAVLLVFVALAAGLDRPAVAALPLLVVLVAHSCFVRQCADEVGRPLHRLQRLLAR